MSGDKCMQPPRMHMCHVQHGRLVQATHEALPSIIHPYVSQHSPHELSARCTLRNTTQQAEWMAKCGTSLSPGSASEERQGLALILPAPLLRVPFPICPAGWGAAADPKPSSTSMKLQRRSVAEARRRRQVLHFKCLKLDMCQVWNYQNEL